MSFTTTEDEKAFYHLKDALGREPTQKEVKVFIETYRWLEVPIPRIYFKEGLQ